MFMDSESLADLAALACDDKKAKDFATADGVRDELLAKGIVLRDGPEGTSWSKQ